MLTNERYL
jgi:hypothetical protein